MSKNDSQKKDTQKDYLSQLEDIGHELGMRPYDIGLFKNDALKEIFIHHYIKRDPILPLTEKQIAFNEKLIKVFSEVYGYPFPIDYAEKSDLTGTLFLGTPGHSKTAFAGTVGRKFANLMGLTYVRNPNEAQLPTILANPEKYFIECSISAAEYTSPNTFGGLPSLNKELGVTSLLPLTVLRAVKEAFGGIVVLDDVMNANDQLLNALLNLAQFRETKMYSLNKMILCSGNIAGVDGSLAKEVPTPLMNRLAVHLVYLSFEEWSPYIKTKYATYPGQDLGVRDFLGLPQYAHLYSEFPSDETRGPFTSPRSWTNFIEKGQIVSSELESGRINVDVAIDKLERIAYGVLGKSAADGLKTYYATKFSKAYTLANNVVNRGHFSREDLDLFEKFYKNGASAEETYFKELFKPEFASRLANHAKKLFTQPFGTSEAGKLTLERLKTRIKNEMLPTLDDHFFNQDDNLLTVFQKMNETYLKNSLNNKCGELKNETLRATYKRLFGADQEYFNGDISGVEIRTIAFAEYVFNLIMVPEVLPHLINLLNISVDGLRPLAKDGADLSSFLETFFFLFYVNVRQASKKIDAYLDEQTMAKGLKADNHSSIFQSLVVIYKFYMGLFKKKWYEQYRTDEYKIELIDTAIRERVMRNILNDFVTSATNNFTPLKGAGVTYAKLISAYPETLKHINEMAYQGKPRSYKLGALTEAQMKKNEESVRKALEGFGKSLETFGQEILAMQSEKETEVNRLAVNVLSSLRGAKQDKSLLAEMYEKGVDDGDASEGDTFNKVV